MYGYTSNRRGYNMSREKIDRTGEEGYNTFGTLMKIIEYKNANDIIVEFQDEYKTKVHTRYCHFEKGNVKNPYDKSVFGVGYLGTGKYNWKDYPYIYKKWCNMLRRCYDPYELNNNNQTYRDVIVCKKWHNFQNFCKWYKENIYECNNEEMHLDKDILIKGNKIYSPKTCIIVPQKINSLFVKCDKSRGEYPIGVSWDKKSNKFIATCRILDKENKKINLGYYNTSEEAFLAYKKFKEKYIKQVADEFKYLIPQKLYEALYKYEVEIND